MIRLKKRKKDLFLFLLILFFLVPSSAAENEPGIAGSLLNGPSFDIVEENGYLYVGQGGDVRIYDIKTSYKKENLDWKDYISEINGGSELRTLYISAPYLYIAGGGDFIIADISNPLNPEVLSSLENPYPDQTIRDVEIYGNYAYLSIYGKGIQVVDISNKNQPEYGRLISLSGYKRAWRSFADNGYLYTACGTDNRLDIFDISDPSNPRHTGSFSPDTEKNSFSGVAVKGNYAYVTEYHKGLRIIDISDPKNPHEISNIMDINANDIKILDNYAYVSVRYQGFDIIDISDPKNPLVVGEATGIRGYIEGIYPSPGYTYLSGESMGFGIYDTSDITSPTLLVNVPVIGGIDSITVNDNYAYIGAHNDGMWIVELKDIQNPSEAAFIAAPGRFTDVFLQDNYLFSAAQWGGLNMIDVSKPYDPLPVFLDFGPNIGSVIADGNYIYTSAGIVDLNDKTSPEYIATAPFFKGRLSLLDKNHLLVAAYTGGSYGIRVIDISDKSNPILINTYNIETKYQDVKASSKKAVALSGSYISIIDFSDIKNPVLIDEVSYRGKWTGRSLHLKDSLCYAAGGPSENIKIFDLNDFSKINLLSSTDLPGVYNCIDAENGFIIAGQKFGLYILSSDERYAKTNTENPISTSSKISQKNYQTPEISDNLKSVKIENEVWFPLSVIFSIIIFLFFFKRKR